MVGGGGGSCLIDVFVSAATLTASPVDALLACWWPNITGTLAVFSYTVNIALRVDYARMSRIYGCMPRRKGCTPTGYWWSFTSGYQCCGTTAGSSRATAVLQLIPYDKPSPSLKSISRVIVVSSRPYVFIQSLQQRSN